MNGSAVNPIVLSGALTERISRPLSEPVRARPAPGGAGGAAVIDGLLEAAELGALLAELDAHEWQPVGLDGIAAHYEPARDRIGSLRASADSVVLAGGLWRRLEAELGGVFSMARLNTVDHHGHDRWRAIGLNPRLRFIRYLEGGLLIPHYDAPYDPGDGRLRTLRTVVIYLEQGGGGGAATRFIADAQAGLPYEHRDFSDWDRPAQAGEVVAQVEGRPGQALVFDHRVLHDSEPLRGAGRKTILRTDIVFEAVRG
jgi:hypothetical protein